MNGPPAHGRIALLICAVLLAGFAVVAWCAIQTKSPAYDEPYHAISSWVQWNRHDFRIDNEDPPLWMYWASLPNGPGALSADFTGAGWQSIPRQVVRQWYWGMVTLYRTPGNDPAAFINRCRGMMLSLAVLLGAMIAYWSWEIGRAVAAIVATALFALDPNFLAHSALMKNDVVFALSLLLLTRALWKAGQRLTIWNGLLIALLCIVTLTVKFSGLIAVLLVPAMLGLRAVLPEPWTIFGRSVPSRIRRLIVAVAVIGICAVVSYIGIWAVYGFRFRPTPEANVWLNMEELADRGNMNRRAAEFDGHPPPGAFDHVSSAPTVRAVMFANQHGLLPQAYLAGFLFTYDASLIRPSYLCGELSLVGWWWYFPFAMLVKTPVATLLGAVAAGVLAWRVMARRYSLTARVGRPGIESQNGAFRSPIPGLPARAIKERDDVHDVNWTVLCLAVPFAIFLTSAIFSHLNIGIRHVLGLYSFAFIAMGWVASTVWARKKARLGVIAILVALSIESLASYPNFISFFNVVADTSAGEINLLGDSNLDWGQDLPLLRRWQQEHPDEKLYLSYFGYADPAYYHIRYVPLPGGYHYDPKPAFPDPYSKCVLAISATNLQGILVNPALKDFYAGWRKQTPIAVLGGSIYLYRYDPAAGIFRR